MTRLFLISLFYFSFLALAASQVHTLPIIVDDPSFVPFNKTIDQKLQSKLTNMLMKNPEYKKLIKNKNLCLSLMDISNPLAPKSANVNGQHMMYAASLPKIAILLGVMDALDNGELQMTDEIDHDLTRMIRYSDNQASTRMIDLIGYEKIASVLQNPKYDFYDEDNGGGLWVGKRYAASGRRYPEPLKGLSHAATSNQVSRFYYHLAYGRLVSCEKSEMMLKYMSEPALKHKFVNCLQNLCPEADVYRKSGTWRTYHSDSVLVIGKEWRNYILVALINDPNGEAIMRQLLPLVEDIIN